MNFPFAEPNLFSVHFLNANGSLRAPIVYDEREKCRIIALAINLETGRAVVAIERVAGSNEAHAYARFEAK